ncbi:MAG: molybdopterin-guanine dinucleotide biosynthesis protein B [Bacillota bacterium]|nr:molybdopterin-guanine dinucleotide biosynthesis protein B [Bacillota bacterium]
MRIVMIKGFSKTGKTTTVTALASELRSRGYSVGTVKDIHFDGFRADSPGTDTFKHMEAGACRVTARGSGETAMFADRQMSIDEILKYYKEDFVILEGDCGLKCPTIITGRTVEDVDRRMCPEAVAVSGIIAESTDRYRDLPVINGRTEVKRLADLVEKKTEKASEELDVQLTIDGEEIWMVPFVKKTLKNVVVGAVKALDGYEDGKEIVIKIK